jgi:uncharacterized Zn-finger protein
MKSEPLSGYSKLNTDKDVEVSRNDLPLHCPTDESAVWCSHPRVFLPIEDSPDGSYRCPYCGTLYKLKD